MRIKKKRKTHKCIRCERPRYGTEITTFLVVFVSTRTRLWMHNTEHVMFILWINSSFAAVVRSILFMLCFRVRFAEIHFFWCCFLFVAKNNGLLLFFSSCGCSSHPFRQKQTHTRTYKSKIDMHRCLIFSLGMLLLCSARFGWPMECASDIFR